VNFKNVYKSFDKLTILNNFTYDFQKGEKVCIVGNNGTGKSTFLNLLTGNINPDKGEIEIGSTIEFGYYKQDGIKINDNERVIDVVTNIAEFIEMDKGKSLSASAFLNKFLFPPEKQYNLVSKLSGGEKRRLYLLTVLIKNPNFLILDEPTNDLDIMTLNVLEDFLKSYQGVVIIVSHDRYFNDKIADRLFVFSGNGEVKGFEGNYTQYRNYKEQIDEEALNVTTKEIKTLPVEKIAKSKKMGFNEKREYETLEKEIEELNKQKLKIEEFLNSGSSNHNLLEEKAKEIAEIIAKIDNKELRWLELSELL
jgi:ATP-binding cassette subfamily F protein uup